MVWQERKDGHLILMHDSKLDRTTTGKGLVADHTLAEIKALQLRNGCHIKTIYKVPTLEEALLFAKGRVMLNLDKALIILIRFIPYWRRQERPIW